jgi:uncharacterized protein (TIGR02270 family)
MTTPQFRPIPWDIYEEHLSESAWLWQEWEQALDSPLYALGDVVVGPEERLHAHLDGLVLGGARVAEKLLLPALGKEEPGEISAAAWALVQAEDADHQDAVIKALASAEPPVQQAIARALSLCPRLDLSRLVQHWSGGAGPLRALILDGFGPREPAWVREHLDQALRSGQAPLVAAGLRAVRRLRERTYLDHVQLALQSEDAEVRREAISAGLVLGAKAAWIACRSIAATPGPGPIVRFTLGVLGSSPDPNDRAFVRGKIADAEAGQHAIWASGFAGDVEAADLIVQAMADEEKAPLAGEALAAITDVAIAGALAKPGETEGPEKEEVAEDAPPPEVRPEDHLPMPQAEAVKKWWETERSRFQPGIRFIKGQPHTTDSVRAAVATAPTWRREILMLMLATMKGPPPPEVDLKGWARAQLLQLGGGNGTS